MQPISRALQFAVEAYDGKTRKGDQRPMVLHAMEAAAIAASLTADEEIIMAAALHDVAEDAGVPLTELKERFGPRVAKLVASETEDKRANLPPADTWRTRKEEAVAVVRNTGDPGVQILFLSDKLSNMRSFYSLKQQLGSRMWERFHQKDAREHHWYYRSIADALAGFQNTLAWKEYDRLIRLVFEETESI